MYWKWVSQSCPTLCSPMDYIVQRILQARILAWVAFPFSRGSSQPRDWPQVSHIGGRFFTTWATKEAHHFSSVAQSCQTLCNPMNWSMPGLPSITNSQSSLKLMSIESVMPSSHLILCHPLLLLPSIQPPHPHQSLFQWVNSSHEVAKVLEFQL